MSARVITPPAAIVTLAEAKRQLAMDPDDVSQDELIDALVRAMQAEIEPPDSWIGRAFGLQELELRLDETAWFWNCRTGRAAEIVLPYPPLALDPEEGTPLVDSVKYLDTDNVLQTLATDQWRVLGTGTTGVAKIALAYNQSWPSTLCDPEAIRVQFTAGYAADDPQLLPAKQAILVAIGQLRSMVREDLLLARENVPGVGTQEWALSSAAGDVVTTTMDRLLCRYRVYALA